MNCSKYRLQIDTARDMDRLPPAAAHHVAACRECERFGRELFELRALLREPGRVSAPDDFDARLARRLREAKTAPAARSGWSWLLVPQTGLAAAAALVVMVSAGVAVVKLGEPATSPNNSPEVSVSRPANANRNEASSVDDATTPSKPQSPSSAPQPPTSALSSVAIGSSRPLVRTISNVQPRQTIAPAFDDRRSTIARRDTTIFVRDAGGSRVVNVRKVLVGAEQIVPASASLDAADDAGEKVAF